MSQNAVTQSSGDWALFLDVDGTILEIADTPQDVQVPEDLKELLSSLAVRSEGALALVSGRTLADLDALFAPFRFCAAGVHGCERREPNGCLVRPDMDSRILDRARHVLRKLVEGQADLLLEDKSFGLALHYRRAPHLRMFAGTLIKSALATLAPAFTLLEGQCVYEIRPSFCNKATAIAAFMAQTPFCGRRPVFIGDDLTDEDAFEYVNARGGMSIKVGTRSPSAAKYTVGRVADSRTDIQSYAEIRRALEQAAGRTNGRFADTDWTPIRYLNRNYPHSELMGFLRMAEVALVTPLRDGMNLVAKEYVAAQDADNPGVLVLSTLAGAAGELSAAIVVNPYDTRAVVHATQSALTMSLSERRDRHASLLSTLRGNDVAAWAQRFIADLGRSSSPFKRDSSARLQRESADTRTGELCRPRDLPR